jgi:hypothetical protein
MTLREKTAMLALTVDNGAQAVRIRQMLPDDSYSQLSDDRTTA